MYKSSQTHGWNYFLLQEYISELEKKFGWKELSYFELNLETWRQLWRVLEMSDIVLIIVDIRYCVSACLWNYHYEHFRKYVRCSYCAVLIFVITYNVEEKYKNRSTNSMDMCEWVQVVYHRKKLDDSVSEWASSLWYGRYSRFKSGTQTLFYVLVFCS